MAIMEPTLHAADKQYVINTTAIEKDGNLVKVESTGMRSNFGYPICTN